MSARLPALPACLALAALLCACGGGSDAGPKRPGAEKAKREPDAIAVRTATAEERTLSELWSSSATLRPERQATVTARSGGKSWTSHSTAWGVGVVTFQAGSADLLPLWSSGTVNIDKLPSRVCG